MGIQDKTVEGCANCHGPQGIGLSPSYPYLAGQQAGYIRQQLVNWQQGKRNNDVGNVMQYIANKLDGHDIDAVAQYFSTLRPAVESVEPSLVGQSETGNTQR